MTSLTLQKGFSAKETEDKLLRVVRLQKKLLNCGQGSVIAESTTFVKKVAELQRDTEISLAARLAQLAKVRANLDSAQEEKFQRREDEFSKRKKEQDERKADLDFREAHLEKRKEQIDKMYEEHDAINATFIKRFEVLADMEATQKSKNAELVVREKKVLKGEKEVLEGQKENTRKHEALNQLGKSYARLQPQPKPSKNVTPPDFFMDNVFTLDVMEEPVVVTDGFTYEKRCILEWFSTKRTSPTTGAVLTSKALIPNHSLKSQINQWREEQARRS